MGRGSTPRTLVFPLLLSLNWKPNSLLHQHYSSTNYENPVYQKSFSLFTFGGDCCPLPPHPTPLPTVYRRKIIIAQDCAAQAENFTFLVDESRCLFLRLQIKLSSRTWLLFVWNELGSDLRLRVTRIKSCRGETKCKLKLLYVQTYVVRVVIHMKKCVFCKLYPVLGMLLYLVLNRKVWTPYGITNCLLSDKYRNDMIHFAFFQIYIGQGPVVQSRIKLI